MPRALLDRARRGPEWADWLHRLPRLIQAIAGEWELEFDGRVLIGETAAVLPAVHGDGERVMAKFGWPHPEAAYEHLALRAWAGEGAVRLLRADPVRSVLLLERAEPGHDLQSLPVLDACAVVAGLYPRLHRSPLPQLDRLSAHARRWSEGLAALRETRVLPRRFVDQAVRLCTDFAADPGTDVALVHTDLHYANVLAATREAGERSWLAIDPKPLAGDPAYEVAPLLWNRFDEAVAAPNLREAVLDRLFTVVDLAALDEERVRDWAVVRSVVNIAWAVSDPAADRDQDWITAATTILKAVQR